MIITNSVSLRRDAKRFTSRNSWLLISRDTAEQHCDPSMSECAYGEGNPTRDQGLTHGQPSCQWRGGAVVALSLCSPFKTRGQTPEEGRVNESWTVTCPPPCTAAAAAAAVQLHNSAVRCWQATEWVSSDVQQKTHETLTPILLWGTPLFICVLSDEL